MIKLKYNGSLIKRENLLDFYQKPVDIFYKKFGYYPRENIKELLSSKWDKKNPISEDEFIDFYRNEPLVVEELVLWYSQNNSKRSSRSQISGSIANDFKCKTFAEFGCGLGVDAISLEEQGLKPVWLADINLLNFEILKELWSSFDKTTPLLVDLVKTNPKDLPVADLLYSSDTIEHLKNPEEDLKEWIGNYRVVIIYAPFARRDNHQHQHTSYPAKKFHKFMNNMGFDKIVYNLAIPPFVYVKR